MANLAIAPMPSLDPDVLSEIFELACSTPASITLDEMAVPAVVFSQVCRSWRSLALSQPSLWSSLSWGRKDEDMLMLTDYPAADTRLVQLWDLYLSRSRQDLLDISLFLYEKDDVELREHLLDCIFTEQHRLENLKLYCRETTIPDGKKYILNAAPRLKILKIHVSAYNANRPQVPLSKCITVDTSRLSTLQELIIYGDVLVLYQTGAFDSLQLVRFWPNAIDDADSSMSHALALPPSSSAFLSFLHCVPHIQEISFIIDDMITLPFSPRLLLRHLRKLSLYMNTGSSEVLDSLLGKLDIPALETLELHFYGDSQNGGGRWRWDNGVLLNSVKKLVLEWDRPVRIGLNPIYAENLRSLLQCTPALKTLEISAEWISPRILSLLTLAPGPSENVPNNLCPGLEALSLANLLCYVSYQEIVDLISSRVLQIQGVEGPQLSGLKDVYLLFRVADFPEFPPDGPEPEMEDLEPIRSFIEQGLKFNAMIF